MRIISRELYPYAKRALDIVHREHGDERTILIQGAILELGKDYDGNDAAVFYSMRESFHYDVVKQGLQDFIEPATEPDAALVCIVDRPINEYRQQHARLAKVVAELFNSGRGWRDDTPQDGATGSNDERNPKQ